MGADDSAAQLPDPADHRLQLGGRHGGAGPDVELLQIEAAQVEHAAVEQQLPAGPDVMLRMPL